WQIRLCSNHNRDTHSTSAHLLPPFGESQAAHPIRFGNANETDVGARAGGGARGVYRLSSNGNTFRTSLLPATSSPVRQCRCKRGKIRPGCATDKRSSNRHLRMA